MSHQPGHPGRDLTRPGTYHLGSRAAGLAMVFKLVKAAEDRWRYVNGRTWSPWPGQVPS